MKKAMGPIILLIIIVLIAFLLPACDEKEIRSRMTSNGIKVTDIDSRVFSLGPYYYFKNCRVYKVDTDQGTFWVRFGTFSGPDIYQQIGDDYKEQKW